MPDYGLVTDAQDLQDFAELLLSTKNPIGFDVETGYEGEPRDHGAVRQDSAYVVGFSFTNSRHWARYVPIRHDQGPNVPEALDIFAPVLIRGNIVAHNAGFERRLLHKEGISGNFVACTMLEAYCVGKYPELGLKPLALRVFGHEMANLLTLWPGITAKAKKQIRFNDRDQTLPEVIDYACEDAAWCLALHEEHRDHIREHRAKIFAIEMEAMPVVSDMEKLGVGVDFKFLRDKASEGQAYVAKAETEVVAEIAALAKATPEELCAIASPDPEKPIKAFNLNSAQQLRRVLFDHCGFKVNKKTNGGEMSTGEAALTTLAKTVPEVDKLLTYRKLRKLIGSYLEKWPRDYSQGEDIGRAYPGWKQTGVPAGRFSVSDPPVQTCPKVFHYDFGGVEFTGNFRDSIVAAPGFYLLDFDYSQIELRVIAGLAQEPKLLDAFAQGLDPHILTAALINNKDPDKVTDKERSQGKTFNFALIYQMGKRSLADRLGVPQRRGNVLYDRFFEGYGALEAWIEEQKYKGTSREYVETYFGRRVPIFEFEYSRKASDPWKAKGLYGHGERLCVNAPVQGTAADIAKMAMHRSTKALQVEGLYPQAARIVINNHDELVFEVAEDLDPNDMIELLRPAVEIEVPGLPPLETDWEVGTKWGSIQSVKGEEEL